LLDTLSISVCIVTYNPDTEIVFKIIHILKNARLPIILIDNNSSDKNFLSLLQSVNTIIPLENNVGLGKAYNICCKVSKELGAEWVLFLDQDSLPLEPFSVNEVIEKLKMMLNFIIIQQ
jgi:Predicted glycosyltransferases